MTPSEELHSLIHTLDKSEKAWFALHAEKGADYQRLYEAIRKQDKYDELAIKQQFAGESFLKRLPSVKNYLYHFILQCLLAQHGDDELQTKLTTQLRFVELLLEKDQRKPALKMVRKVRQQSIDQDLFLLALEAIAMEKNLLRSNHGEEINREIQQLDKEEQVLIRKYENLVTYKNLEMQLSRIRQTVINSRTQADLKQFRSLLLHPILKKEEMAFSFEAQILFNRIKGACSHQLGHNTVALKFRKRLVQLYESLPFLNGDQIMRYSGALLEIGTSLRSMDKADEALAIAMRIASLEKNYPQSMSERRKSVLFKRWAMLETDVLQYTGRFEKGVQRLNTIEKLQRVYTRYIDSDILLILNYNAAHLYYGAGQLKKALQKINTIIHDHEGQVGHDVVCFAHVFRLIIHIDLGNDDLIASIARSTATYLEKRKRLFRTETLFLEFSMQLIKGKYGSRIELLKKMKARFDQIRNMSSEKNVVEFFDFSAWFISHIDRRSFAEVYRELRPKQDR